MPVSMTLQSKQVCKTLQKIPVFIIQQSIHV